MAQKKRQRILERRLHLADRIIAAALTTSTILSPLSVFAADSNIKAKGDWTTVKTSGSKHTVTTNKKDGDKAFNRFSNFELAQGHIANMILPSGVKKLYNFVDEQVNIQGTVNALKAEANRIGGHLLFVSPKGMIVGEKGAINAGKFSAIIADEDTYNAILKQDAPWSHEKFKLMDKGYVALDPKGSIVVQGRITAPDGIDLKAAKITTGSTARLETTKVDFSSLVNVASLDNEAFTADRSEGSLVLKRTESGDVRLESIATNGKDALIDHAGQIDAEGSVVMRARASGNSSYSPQADEAGEDTPFDGGVDFVSTATAKVVVRSGGSVKAKRDVTAKAETYNYRTNDKFDLLADVAKELFNDLTPFTFDGSYTNLKSAADVTIESGASLEAGKNLMINSVSAVGVKTGTDLGFMELLEWKTGDKFPSASVVVSKQTGSATATVGGSLKAGGDVTVTAASSLSADLFAEGTVENTSGTAPFQVALVWADLKNDAAATIAPDATVAAGGFLTVQSNVSNSVETKAEIGLSSTNVPNHSPGGTALNATFVTTGAKTDVGSGAALSASGDVTVNAVNYTDSWTSKAGVKVAAEPFYSQKIKKNLTMPAFKALYKRLGDKLNLPEDLRYGNGASSGDYDGSTWTLAVLYTGQDVFADKTRPSQQGSVTIAPGARLSSDAGSVVLSSDVLVYDHQWSAVSRAGGNVAKSQDHGNAYGLAVMYDNADVSSDISIGKGSQLLAGGSIDIQSGARVEWNRLTVTIENLKNTWEQLKKFATIERTRQEWEEAKKLLTDDLYHDTDLSNWEGFKNYSKGIGEFIKTAFTFLTDVAGAGSSAVQLAFSDTLAFIDMESYANVYSKVMARTSNAQDQNFSGGGSFSWSNWRVKNKIDIAREARLSADSGDVTVAGFTRSDVSVIGGWNSNVAGGILASSQGRALGGTVLVSTFDTQNDVQVHKGALLESRDGSLSLTTSDASMQLAANLSAAKAGKWGFQGQLNVLDASIAGRVRVDDEATLKSSAILIQSDAENYATNVAAAIETAQEKALGAAFAIDVLNYENAARVADFDAAFSDDAAPFADAYIAADSLTVNAYSHSHVNTVAVAGSAAWTKEEAQAQGDGQGGGTMKKIGNFPLKVTEKLGNWFGNLLSPSAQSGDQNVLQPDDDDLLDPENANLNDSISDGSSQIDNDINNSVSRSDSSSSEPFHFEENYEDNNALDNANQPGAGGQRANLNLSAAGSVAWNFADYTAHAGLEGTSSQPLTIISFTENSAKSAANRTVSISAQADKWQAAFSGGAAAALGAGGAEVTSVGIGGTLSVNSGKSIVSADLTSVKIGALDASKGATKDVISLSAGSSGRSVVGALGLAVTKGSDESGAALAANVSANTLNNRAKSTVSGVSFDTSAAAKAVSTDLDVLSYAKDTQVTGAVDLAVGKSKAAVGAGIQVAVIKNDIGSTIINSTLNNLGAVSIDSFLGVKQVVAGIAVAAGAGNSESAWAYSGALVVDTLINKASAQVLSSDLTAAGTAHIAAGDGADIDKSIKQHEASTSFDLTVSADTTAFAELGSTESFYKGAELETSNYYKKFTEGKAPADSKTTTVDQTLTGRTGLTIITGALTGSGTANGSAAGTAAVVNNLRNTMTTNVQNSTITAAGLNAGSENGTALVAVAAGAAVGRGSWAADGSVIWNSIVNRANTTVQNAAITITGTNANSLTAQNRALSVGVAGAVGLSVGKVAAGVSLGYSHVTNDAVLSVTGGANKMLSGAGGALSAAAQNSANSWLAAVAVPVSTQSGAGGGIGALHRITGETSAVLDGLTIDGWSGVGVTASEKSSAKTLAGAVTVSAQAGAVGGTVAVTQIGTLSGKDQAHTLHAAVNNSTVTMADSAGTLNVATSDDASILTVAVGGGYGGNFQGTGAVGVNLLHRRDLAELNTTNVTRTKTAVSLMGEKSSSLLNVGVEISGGSTGAGGGAIVVNHIGDENLASVPGSKIDVGSFSSLVNSDTRLINAVLGFSGGGTGAGQGMVLVNSVSPVTALNIEASVISADQSLAAIAQSDTEMRNYAGQGAGGGTGAGAGLIEVNYLNDVTSAVVENSGLTVKGAGEIKVSHDIADGDVTNAKFSSYVSDDKKYDDAKDAAAAVSSMPDGSAIYDNAFRGVFDSKTLRTQRRAETLKGLVIDASSTHVLTDVSLAGAGAGMGAGAGSVNVDILAGATTAKAIDSDLSSSSDISVRASDFSNTAGVFIAGAGAGMGAGAGIVGVRHVKRTVEGAMTISDDESFALNAKGTAAAGAVSKQSLTAFTLSGAGAGMGAGSGVVTVDIQKGTTAAEIKGGQGSVGGLQSTADHFSRIGTIEVTGAGAGMGAGAIIASVGVDMSETSAGIRGVSLDVTNSGAVKLDARNRLKGYNVYVLGAGAGMGSGSIGVGVDYSRARVNASIEDSTIGAASQRAGAVTINSSNNADILTVAATASGAGFGSGSILVNVDNLYSNVGVNVSNSIVYANSITVSADEDYKLRAHAWGASGAGFGAGLVYVQVINVGDAGTISDPDNQKQLASVSDLRDKALDKLQGFVDGTSGAVSSRVLTEKEAAAAKAARTGNPVIKNSENSTLHVTIDSASVLDASGDVTIAGTEKTDIISYQGGVTGALGAGAVNLGFMSVAKQAGVAIDAAKLNAGGAVSVTSQLTGTNNQHIVQGTGGAGSIFTAYGHAKSAGKATIAALSSDIAGAKGVSLAALDSAVTDSYGAGGSAGIGTYGGIVARAITDDTVSVTFDGGRLTSGGDAVLMAKRTGETFAQDVFGYIGVASGIGADARASESTNVNVSVGSGDTTTISAKKFAVHSELNPFVHARVYQDGGSVGTSVGVPLAKASLSGGSAVTLGAKNAYAAPAVSVESFVGGSADKGAQLFARVDSYGGTLIGIEYQYSRAEVTNDSTAAIDMKGGAFDAKTFSALSMHALNSSTLSADMETIRVGGLAIGSANNAAHVTNHGKATIAMTSANVQTLASMDVKAESISDSKARANGDGGSAVYIDNASSSSGSSKAAWAKTDVQNTASVDISGQWKTNGDLKLTAAQTAKTTDWADAVIGGAITVNGTQHDLGLIGNAAVTVAKGAVLSADGAMTLEASNTLSDNPNNAYTSSGNSYGAVSGNGTKNNATVTQNATVTIAESAALYSASATSLLAHSDSAMNEYARIVSGGVGAGSDAVNNFTGTWNNTITIKSGADVTTNGDASDVTLAAWDNAVLKLTALGDMQGGVVGGATSKLDFTLNRNNAVNVAGTILSGRDVNLWAGQNSAGEKSRFTVNGISHAYAHGPITGASAKLNRTINQKNTVTIDGDVSSTRHANLAALTGELIKIESAERYAWTSSKKTGSVSSTALGDTVGGLNDNNTVTVNGTVNAGIHNKFVMNIGEGFALLEDSTGSGDYAPIEFDSNGKLYVKVLSADYNYTVSNDEGQSAGKMQSVLGYRQGTSTDYDYVLTIDGKDKVPTITLEAGDGKWKLGQVNDYASYLYDRLALLNDLIEEYNGDQSSFAYLAFCQERQVVEATLAQYGLPPNRNEDGDKNSIYNGDKALLFVPYIELAPVTVSGGNVVVNTTSLKGTGTLNANGAPEITVNNASNYSLKLTGMNILAPGGEVIVNTFSVKSADDMHERVKKNTSGFSGTVNADAHGSKTAAITVRNTWNEKFVSASVDENPAAAGVPNAGSLDIAVVSDIENTGGIRNYPGTVELATQVGSIRSVSGDIVAGKGVKLSAPRGAVTITSQGILNVGGAPEADGMYGAAIRSYAEMNWIPGQEQPLAISADTPADTLVRFLSDNSGLDLGKPNGIVAGGSIYITAGTINVNGTIQSGYGKYELKLSDAQQTKLDELYLNWLEAGGEMLPDDPTALSTFVLTEGGDIWDVEQRAFVRNPKSWYNPSTGRIIVEDMIGAGGSVYLTGRVVNTNFWDLFTDADYSTYEQIRNSDEYADAGLPSADDLKAHRSQIIAYSGAAEVSIENSLKETICVNAIDTGMRSGNVVINDIQNVVSSDGSSETHKVDGVSGDVFKTTVVRTEFASGGVLSGDYQPQTGVRYNVGAGMKQRVTERLSEWEYFNWWRDSWKNRTPDGKSYQVVRTDTVTSLDQGATVGLLDDLSMNRIGVTEVMDPGEIVWIFRDSVDQTPDPQQPWNYDVHYNNWTHFAGKITRTQITTSGVQSTTLVSLKADNPIHVEIKTAKNPGAITLSAASADVELMGAVRSSVEGAAVSITAKDIVAETGGTIVADKVLLNASGAIAGEDKMLHLRPLGDVVELTASASNGMAFDIDSGSAKVTLNSNGEKGTIKVDSEGSLTGEATGTNMDLLSRNGSIEMNVKGSETKLKAKAADDISIVKVDEGDLAIERVEAENDVFLETKQGSIVDANPTVNQQSLTDEALIDLWKNAGLISDDESGSRMTAKMREDNIANLENIVRSEYATYQHVKQLLADADARIADGLMTPEQKALFEKQRDALQSYAGVTDIDAYIAEQKKKSGSALYELSTIDENEGWTKDYLLYSIQDAILNPTAGSVKPNAQEIVVGSTVTLKSSVNIGSEGEEQTIAGGDALLENDMKGLKALSQASPADVTWDEDSSSFIVQDSYEIGLTAGRTTAQAQDLVLIASPLEDLVIDSVESKNGAKVHLMAAGSVLLHPSSDITPAVKGGDMFISAAGEASDIGSADRAVTIEQTTGSELRANAGRSIYLTAESGDLMLGSIAARDTLAVETTEEGANILMSKGEGRLNARAVLLTVNSGDIGTEELPVRVQNAQSNDFSRSVTLNGANNAYLSGENGAQPEGWLNLNAGTLHNAVVTSDGGLNISGDMTASGAGTFAASSDVVVLGSLTGGSLNVTAQNGAAVFDGPITAGKLSVRAHDDLELNEPVNVENAAELNVSAGSIEVRGPFAAHELEAVAAGASSDIILGKDVKVAEDLTLAASRDVIMLSPFAGGTLTASAVRSAKFDGAIDADGAVTVDVGEDLTTAELKSNADVTLDAGGSIAVNGALKGNEVKLSSGTNVKVKGTATAETLRAESGSDTMLGDVKAATVTARAGSSITTGAVTAQQTVDIAASRDITVDGTLNGAAATLDAGRNVTVNGAAFVGALAVTNGANTTLSDVDANDLTANAGGSLTVGKMTAASADLRAKNNVTTAAVSADEVIVDAGGTLTTKAVTAKRATLDASADIIVEGPLTGGEFALTAGNDITVKDTTTAEVLSVTSGADTKLADVDAETLTANAGGNLTVGKMTAVSADLSAKNNVTTAGVSADELTVDAGGTLTTKAVTAKRAILDTSADIIVEGPLTGGEFALTAGNDITVKDTTTAEVLNVTSGADTKLADVDAETLTANAGGSIATGNITANEAVLNSSDDLTTKDVSVGKLDMNAGGSLTTASVTAENVSLDAGADIIVDGSLTADDPQLTAGENVTVKGTTTADALTVNAGKNVTLARTIVPAVDVNAGGHVSMEDRGNDMDALNLSADSSSVYDINALKLNAPHIGDLNAEAAGVLTASVANKARNVTLTSSGASVDVTTDLNADNVTVNAKETLEILRRVTVTNTARFTSSADVTVSGSVKSEHLSTESGGETTLAGAIETVDLTSVAGGRILVSDRVKASGDIELISRNAGVTVEEDIRARNLLISARETIAPAHGIFVTDSTTLRTAGDIALNGEVQSGTLTTVSGGNTDMGGSVSAREITASAAGSITTVGLIADEASLTASRDVAVRGALNGGDFTLKSQNAGVMLDGPATVRNLTASVGENLTVNGAIEARGDVELEAEGSAALNADASADGDLSVSAFEISARDLSAGQFLAALSQSTFTGNDLNAGKDVRVHTYGDMTFNDATAGGNAWILGLGSSAARIKFHEVCASGLDTAVLLERGYLDFWSVTAGLDGGVGVRHFEGPKRAGTLTQGTKIRVYFPYGGSLMPKDPFNFHVRDLLQNKDVEPYDRDSVNLWPPRDRRLPDPNLQAGSDDIEINLDEYEYWLPEEIVDMEAGERPLSVSGK